MLTDILRPGKSRIKPLSKAEKRKRRAERAAEKRATQSQSEQLSAIKSSPGLGPHVRRGFSDTDAGADAFAAWNSQISDAKRLRYRKPHHGWKVAS